MKTHFALAAVLGLSACENIEIQYTAPAKAGDFKAAEAQANEHYEFVAFPKAYILVTPVQEDSAKKTEQQGSVKNSQDSAAKEAKQEQQKSSKGDTPAAKTRSTKSKATTAAKDGATAAAPDSAVSAPPAKQKASDGTGDKAEAPAAAAPTLNDSLSSAVIDNKTWKAKVVLMPDDSRVFVVKGVSGFWKSTTIGVTKYQNSDMVSSVSSTAENLVPKRIGQVASIVATAVQIGAVFGVDGTRITTTPLESFVVEVPAQGPKSDSINADWTYSFKYDSDELPAGTVSYKDFNDKSMDRKVAYWPTPACRSATLTIGRASDHTRAAFHVVVSSPDVIRLQPLPAKGKVDFGSVCGATLSGTATVDPVASFSDDLQAVQQAIKTVKDAKAGSGGAGSAAKGGDAAAPAPKK